MHDRGVLQRAYGALVGKGGLLRHDPSQSRVITLLDDLIDRLHAYQHDLASYEQLQRQHQQRKDALAQQRASETQPGWWARWSSTPAPEPPPDAGPPPTPPAPPRGLYVWGSVGSGKRCCLVHTFDVTTSSHQFAHGPVFPARAFVNTPPHPLQRRHAARQHVPGRPGTRARHPGGHPGRCLRRPRGQRLRRALGGAPQTRPRVRKAASSEAGTHGRAEGAAGTAVALGRAAPATPGRCVFDVSKNLLP